MHGVFVAISDGGAHLERACGDQHHCRTIDFGDNFCRWFNGGGIFFALPASVNTHSENGNEKGACNPHKPSVICVAVSTIQACSLS